MATKISFDINCRSGLLSPNGNNSVTITVEDCDPNDVMDLFDIPDLVDRFGEDKFLAHIGEDRVKNYFNLNND